jgi:multiple sugar transport system permease protein
MNRRNLLAGKYTENIILCTAALVVSAIFLFPLYWIFVSSLKPEAEIFIRPPTFLPSIVSWRAYIFQLTGSNSLLNSARNSFIIASSAMTLSFLFAVPAAYGISRFRIPGARAIIMVFLVTQMLPSSLLLTPMFLTFNRLRLLNTYIAPVLAISTITIPFTLLVLRPMFMACPKEIEESARIDGCNRFSAFLRIVMPVIKPGLVTVCCFGFVHGWNDLVYSLTFNTRKEFFPMTSSIYNLMNEYGIRWNMIMAYGCLLVLPPILIFVLAQKYVVSGLIGGAVKG